MLVCLTINFCCYFIKLGKWKVVIHQVIDTVVVLTMHYAIIMFCQVLKMKILLASILVYVVSRNKSIYLMHALLCMKLLWLFPWTKLLL